MQAFQFDPEELPGPDEESKLRSLRNRVLSLSKTYLAGSMIVYDSSIDITF